MIYANLTHLPLKSSKHLPFFLVSGGVDSIAACHFIVNKLRRKVKVLHFNHNYQDANKTMEHSVMSFCSKFGIDCHVITNQEKVINTSENGMRQWRHNEIEKIGGNFITAHHLNDCVENYIDNCLKGHPEYKPINEVSHFINFKVYHPFLLTTKQSFINYCHDNNLMQFVVTDPTNTDNKNKRNWLRNCVLPAIYERNVGIETVVKKKFYI